VLEKPLMPAIVFDTLAFAKKLKEGGFTDQQAEVLAQAQAELFEQNLATKLDLKELETTLRRDMKELETTLDFKEFECALKECETNFRHSLKELETALGWSMKELEYRLVLKLGSLMLVGITVIATLVKLL
jgi:hypothetical protein